MSDTVDLAAKTPESQEGDDAPNARITSRYWFALSTTREERFFLVLAVFIGVFSGLAVVCFRLAIDWSKIWLLGPVPEPHNWRLIAIPALTGLVVAFLVIHVFPVARGSGVNQTKAALYIYNGYIPFRTAVGKFITAALAIGSGQSLGPEDPSLQIGASLASALGRVSTFRANAFVFWRRSALLLDWPPPSMRRSRPFCSLSRK